MTSHSRNSRRPSGDANKRIRIMHRVQEQEMAHRLGKSHAFTVFRIGLDMCAKCRRPRAEHLVSTTTEKRG